MGVVTDTTWQSFGNLEWRFKPDWLLNVGGMLEKHDNTDMLFSPRLALNYSISPRHSIRASMGEGYRAPTLLESNSNEEFLYTARRSKRAIYRHSRYSPRRSNSANWAMSAVSTRSACNWTAGYMPSTIAST